MKEVLEKYKQSHLITYYNDLSESDKIKFEDDIMSIDFELIKSVYSNLTVDNQVVEYKPVEILSREEIVNKDAYIKVGEKLVLDGKLALITLAGGQGTRLDCDGPKGKFFLKNKSLFEYTADKIRDYNVIWLVMTSLENNQETIEFFESNNNFDVKEVKFFSQRDLPLLDKFGKLIIGENGFIKYASSGNGDIYTSLKLNNLFEYLKSKGVEYVFANNVDNILSNPVDYLALGYMHKHNCSLLCKSIKKNYKEEPVGVFCYKNDFPGVVEYSEITEDMLNLKNNKGELMYNNANITANYLTVDLTEEISSHSLEYHGAIKKCSFLDISSKSYKLCSEEVYKYESFIFDGYKYSKNFVVLDSSREDEFAPIKNKDSVGKDCPSTAFNLYKEFLTRNKL